MGFDAVGCCTKQSSYSQESCNFLVSLYMEIRVPDSLSSGNCLGYSFLFGSLTVGILPSRLSNCSHLDHNIAFDYSRLGGIYLDYSHHSKCLGSSHVLSFSVARWLQGDG